MNTSNTKLFESFLTTKTSRNGCCFSFSVSKVYLLKTTEFRPNVNLKIIIIFIAETKNGDFRINIQIFDTILVTKSALINS